VKKYVIVTGDLNEGLKDVYGSFNSEEEAEDYAETHNLGHWDKVVKPLVEIGK